PCWLRLRGGQQQPALRALQRAVAGPSCNLSPACGVMGQVASPDTGMCTGARKADSEIPDFLNGSFQPNDWAALFQAMEDMHCRMEQQSQDNLEQKLTIQNLRSEIGRLRRSIAERDCEVDWARVDALELHYREVERARCRTPERARGAPDLGKFVASELFQCEDTDAAEHPTPGPRPAVFEAFLTPPPSARTLEQQG
ncbi:unnamed protein product, partial [Prorocentrum cordatum]